MDVVRGYIFVQTLKTKNDEYGNQVWTGRKTYRMMGYSELVNWVVLQICNFDIALACKVRQVHGREINDIANCIFCSLVGNRVTSEQLCNTLKKVIEEYGFDLKKIINVSPQKMEEVDIKTF